MMRTFFSSIVLLTLLMSACSQNRNSVVTNIDESSIYQTVLIDFYRHPDAYFVLRGDKIYVSLLTCDGDSLFYSWGRDFVVGKELEDSLSEENRTPISISELEVRLDCVRIVPIETQGLLDMYDPKPEFSDAKCGVRFWKPGFTPDRSRAIVRFAYGPSPHGAVGTYILQKHGIAWRILSSRISHYA